MACQPIYLSPFRESGILSHIARIEELRIFSEDYRDLLLYGPKYRASQGKPINYNAKRVKDRSNAKIGTETPISHEGIYCKILMSNGAVLIDYSGIQYPVIEAPAAMAKGKKTAFLKSVVRTFLDDPENIRQFIPAAAATRAGTQAPAQAAAGSPAAFVVPEDLIERITGSDLPGPGANNGGYNFDEELYRDQESMIAADIEEMKRDQEYQQYDELDQAHNPESPEEIAQAFSQPGGKPAGWVPHLKVSITEELIHA